MATNTAINRGNNAKIKRKSNPRPRPLPPDVNARNLANEKKKRGEMNEKFLEMARLVPGLASAKKLNKVLIVNETVSHLRHQRSVCIAAAHDVQGVLDENRSLRAELEALRRETGQILRSSVQKRPLILSDALSEFLSIETQPLGAFPDGLGGDYGDGAEKDIPEPPPPPPVTEEQTTTTAYTNEENGQFPTAEFLGGEFLTWPDAILSQGILNAPLAMECDLALPTSMESFSRQQDFDMAFESILNAPAEIHLGHDKTADVPPVYSCSMTQPQDAFFFPDI